MNKSLKEIFAPPINLKPAYEIDNLIFYSSDSLKRTFILALKKSSKGKQIASEIEKLVNKQIIIPCYKSKNLFSFLKHKLSKSSYKNIMAFYNVDDKKVIILIDNTSTIFGTSSNNEIATSTIHESMHMIAGRNLSKFIQVFSSNLKAYYSEFFMDYFSLKLVNPKKIDSYIKFIIPLEKYGPSYANKKLSALYKLLQTLFESDSNLSEEEFTNRLTNLIVASKLFIVHMKSLMNNTQKYMMVFTSLNRAYIKAFKEKNIYTMPIQEITSMSEVACVFAEMKPHDPIIKKLFKIIV